MIDAFKRRREDLTSTVFRLICKYRMVQKIISRILIMKCTINAAVKNKALKKHVTVKRCQKPEHGSPDQNATSVLLNLWSLAGLRMLTLRTFSTVICWDQPFLAFVFTVKTEQLGTFSFERSLAMIDNKNAESHFFHYYEVLGKNYS